MDLSFDDEPKMSREAMKDEALDRMELLGLPSYARAALKQSNMLTLSDINDLVCSSRVDGVPEEIMKQIKAWEEKYGALIFHVIHTKVECPCLLSPDCPLIFHVIHTKGLYLGFEYYDCLSVSPYESDWDYERDLMEDRGDTWAMAFQINVTKPEYTGSGSIKIENHSGVLKRVL